MPISCSSHMSKPTTSHSHLHGLVYSIGKERCQLLGVSSLLMENDGNHRPVVSPKIFAPHSPRASLKNSLF